MGGEEEQVGYVHYPSTQRATPDLRLEGLERSLCTPSQGGGWRAGRETWTMSDRGEGVVVAGWVGTWGVAVTPGSRGN